MSDTYQTIKVRSEGPVCYLQFHRPDAKNAINDRLVAECRHAFANCGDAVTVVVLEGLPEVFCFGADFREIADTAAKTGHGSDPAPLYALWLEMATGPRIILSHVRGRANAGGVGFVAASDIVLADQTAQFSLSELLFGLHPACVLPFLIRRIGFQKAHYMTLMTQPVSVQQAHAWGLVDGYDGQSESLVRKHLLRLRRISKRAIRRYKRYMTGLYDAPLQCRSSALEANHEVFADRENLAGIYRFAETGKFPWEE